MNRVSVSKWVDHFKIDRLNGSQWYWRSFRVQSTAIFSKISEKSIAITILRRWNTKLNQISGANTADFEKKNNFTAQERPPSSDTTNPLYKLQDLGFEVLPQLAYSPALDCLIFNCLHRSETHYVEKDVPTTG